MVEEEIPDWASSVAEAILYTVYLKDPFTFFHCCRVGRSSRRLAKAMGLSVFEQNVLEYSGLFHDVGKIGIPDDILLKPARLSPAEIDVMKGHADLSVKVIEPLTSIPFFKFLIPGIRYHHERWDGMGYTAGLEGENIPLPARIITVVDTVDAMSATRPYRKGLSMDIVRQELVKCSDTQFDRKIVDVYLKSEPVWPSIEQPEADEVIISRVLANSTEAESSAA